MIRILTIIGFTIFLATAPSLANEGDKKVGSIKGKISSAKKIKDSQKPVVIWVEGLSGGPKQENKPLISQSGIQFLPRVLAVAKGETVSFPNEDDVAHNVFSMSKSKKFKLGIYPKGDTREVKFDKVGVIDLFCSIHRHMHAVVVVTPSRHFAQTKLETEFTISDVPVGKHKVKIWNSKHKVNEFEIEVKADEVSDLTVTLP